VFNIAFLELFFIEHFECDNELGLLFSREVNMTELASAEGLPELKVLDRPLLLLFFLWLLLLSGC